MSRSKKLLLCFVSLIVIFFTGVAIDLACGPDADPYDYYVSFFHNNVQGEKQYGSFYLDTYDYVFDDREPESEADINSDEWAKYLGHGVKAKDVKEAMYLLPRNDDSIINAEKRIGLHKILIALKDNTFLQELTSGSNPEALQYYLFAKSVEREANVEFTRWDPKPVDTLALQRDGFEALRKATTEQDKFIKLRYLYQAERLLHYSGNIKQAMDVYDHYINYFNTDSHVKGWALALKAGEERHLGDTVQAAYLFSKVFALYPERRVQAYKNFHYCSLGTGVVEKLAVNDKERAVIYTIDGFGTPELNMAYLRKVYGYDPSSEMVGVLLVREINKLEEGYLTPKLNEKEVDNYEYFKEEGADSTKKINRLHLDSLKNFCISLSQDNKYKEPGIGYMASAYLAWMEGSTDEGLQLLSKLDNATVSNKLNDQRQLVKLLLSTQKIEKLNDVNEDQLLPALKWLDNKVAEQARRAKPTNDRYYSSTQYDQNKFAASARDFYKLILAQEYLKQKDTVKAALCILKSETMLDSAATSRTSGNYAMSNRLPSFWMHFLHSNQINQVINWKHQPAGSPYLKFLSSTLSKTLDNDLYDLLGTSYLREHNYSKASSAFKQLKGDSVTWAYVSPDGAADPFIDQVRDYPKTFLRPKSKAYDKVMFAAAMDGLQSKIKSDPQHASIYYYEMATGLYNASHYGNAYYMVSYEWSSYDYGREKRYSYDDDYIKTKTAETYYLKARASSNDPEFKAKCTFMAAKCNQKQVLLPADDRYGDATDSLYDLKVRNNPYFTELKKGYAQTAFYKMAVKDCSYLRDFLKPGSLHKKKQ